MVAKPRFGWAIAEGSPGPDCPTVTCRETSLVVVSDSVVVVRTDARLVSTVPIGVPGATRTMMTKVATAPGASEGVVSTTTTPMAPTAGLVAIHAAGVVLETNAVRSGRMSRRVTALAATPPALRTVTVYVMFPPAATELGVAVLVTTRSARPWTGVSTLEELLPGFGSGVREEALTVLVTVPDAVETWTMTKNWIEVPAGMVVLEKVRTLGSACPAKLVVHPAGAMEETKVVPGGSVSETLTAAASLGPLFVKERV